MPFLQVIGSQILLISERMEKRRSIRHFSSTSVERNVFLSPIRTAGSALSGARVL